MGEPPSADDESIPSSVKGDIGYTRIRQKVQIGDGIDQRGEVTIELMRTTEENSPNEVRWELEDQMDEAVQDLEERLGL